MDSRTTALVVVGLATAAASYGIWYGAFVKEFAARHPWTGRVKSRYKPSSLQRAMVVIVSVTILTAGIAEMMRLWVAH